MRYDYTTASVESVRQETDAGLADADALVDQALGAEEVSFAARVAPLELANARLTAAYGRGAILGQAHPDSAVRDAGSEAEERITKWRAALPFREDLYHAVRAVDDAPEAESLTPEQKRVLFLWMRDFRRAGHALEPAARAELEQLRARLVELEIAFNRNLNEYEDAIELTRDELEGMPDEFVERLSPGSRDGTLRVSLDYPEVYPFLAQSPNRSAREALFRKHWGRSVDANRPLMEEAVRLRQRAAELLGHPTWAHYAIEVKMAETPEAVAAFYESLVPRLAPVRDRGAGDADRTVPRRRIRRPAPGLGLDLLRRADAPVGLRGRRQPRRRVPAHGGQSGGHVRPDRRGPGPRLPALARGPRVAPIGRAVRDPSTALPASRSLRSTRTGSPARASSGTRRRSRSSSAIGVRTGRTNSR